MRPRAREPVTSVALYWDFENLHASLCEARQEGAYSKQDNRFRVQEPLIDIQAVVDLAASFGPIAINRAYCNWQYFSRYRDAGLRIGEAGIVARGWLRRRRPSRRCRPPAGGGQGPRRAASGCAAGSALCLHDSLGIGDGVGSAFGGFLDLVQVEGELGLGLLGNGVVHLALFALVRCSLKI